MSNKWYIESYAADGLAAEEWAHHKSYEEAIVAVTQIVAAGKIARLLAPITASSAQLESFQRLGPVQRI